MIRLKSVRVTDTEWQGISCRKTHSKLSDFKLLMKEGKVLLIKWLTHSNGLVVAFSDGTIVTLFLRFISLHVDYVTIDRFLCHRLSGAHASDLVYREDDVIFLSMADSARITAAFFQPSNHSHSNHKSVTKLKHKDIKFVDLELDARFTGSSCMNGRHVNRRLLVSDSVSLLCVWWQMGSSLSPWSAPSRPDANLLVYAFDNQEFRLLSYGLFGDEIRKLAFSTAHKNRLLILTSPSDLSLHFAVCDISRKELREVSKVFSVTIPLRTPVLQVDLTAAQDKVVILCQDRNCLLYDLNENSAFSLMTSIDATHIMTSPLDSLFVVCDGYGQLLMYDYALSVIPANYDDVCYKANLDFMDSISSVNFLNEQLISLTYTVSEDASRELTLIALPVGIDVPVLMREYLSHDYVTEAIAGLLSLNWNFEPFLCYSCLTIIFNFLLKLPLNPLRESQIESVLASFLRPKRPLDREVVQQYSPEIGQLAKRFFYHLVRFNSLDKAFQLAIDLKSKHLFHLLLRMAQENGNAKLAQLSSGRLEQLLSRERERSRRRQLRREEREQQTDKSATPSTSQSDHRPVRHLVSSAILSPPSDPLAEVSDSAPCNRSSRYQRPPIPAPRTATIVEPIPFFSETVNVVRHVVPIRHSNHSSPLEYEASGRSFESEAFAHSVPPSLPPKRLAPTTRAPDPVSQSSPPPVPPKTFLHSKTQENNNEDMRGCHSKTGLSLATASIAEPAVVRSAIRSAVNRPAVHSSVRTNESGDKSCPIDEKPVEKKTKPRIECIHFGLV